MNETAGAIPGHGLHHVRKMVFNQAFRHAQHLGQLVGGESGAGQEIDDPLARGAFGG